MGTPEAQRSNARTQNRWPAATTCSFSVRLQTYRDIKVAVKEFLPHFLHTDVQNEARILSIICHPHLPYVFGICTTARPYRLVTQFHGIAHKTVTLCKELKFRKKVKDGTTW